MVCLTRRALISALIFGIALFIAGCASFTQYGQLENTAREQYDSWKYDAAVLNVVASLKLEPDYDKSLQLIAIAFPKAVETHLANIDAAKNGNEMLARTMSGNHVFVRDGKSSEPVELNMWDAIAGEYAALKRINQAVAQLPPLKDPKTKQPIHFDIQDYSRAFVEIVNNAAEAHYQAGKQFYGKAGMVNRDQAAKEFRVADTCVPGYKDANTLAAEGYYQEGLSLAKVNDPDSQKQAAKAFMAAQGFVAGYKDSSELYERGRKAGVKRIAIISFEDKSGKSGYGAVADKIVDGIEGSLMIDASAHELLEIVPRSRLEQVMREQKLGKSNFVDSKTASRLGKILGVHEIVTGSINQIIATPQRDTRREIHERQRICVREDKNHKCEHEEEVHAVVTMVDRTAGASISVTYNVMDVKTGVRKQTKDVSGQYAFNAEWANYKGSERALTADERQLVARSESNSPVDEIMVVMAQGDLVKQMAWELKNSAR